MKWSTFQSKIYKKNKNGCKSGNEYLKQFIKYFDFESFDSDFFYLNVAKLNILDDKFALEMLNFHCNGLLNRIDDKYDEIIMNNSNDHHALTPNVQNVQTSLIKTESPSIIKIEHYSGGYLCVDEYNDDEIKIKFENNNNNDYYEWIGIEDQNGFWKFQNVATSKFLTVTPKLKGGDGDILRCNDIDGKSLFCMFMIHITPWKHYKFEPIFIHPNSFLSYKDENIQLSTKNGLYEEFKMIPIEKELKEESDVEYEEIKEEFVKTQNGSIIDHPLMNTNVSKWRVDKELSIEDKFGSYYLAIKGIHSVTCTANKIMDDLSEWIIEFNFDNKHLVRFRNKKSGKYLRISNQGYLSIDCGGNEDDKYCIFKINHNEHDRNLCRLESIEYKGSCIGLSGNGVTVSQDIASDSLIYVRCQ